MMLSVRVAAVDSTVNAVGVSMYEHWRASARDSPASQASAATAQQRQIFMFRSS
jgi:hypothetical protein